MKLADGCFGVAALFVAVGIAASASWFHVAQLPYNSEGRYFDAEVERVYTIDDPAIWSFATCACVATALALAAAGWNLRFRDGGSRDSQG